MPEMDEEERNCELEAFNQELSVRLESLDRGEYVDSQSLREELQRKSRNRRASLHQSSS